MNIITMRRQGWLNVYITSWVDRGMTMNTITIRRHIAECITIGTHAAECLLQDDHEHHCNKKAHCGEHDGGMSMEGTPQREYWCRDDHEYHYNKKAHC